MRKRSKRENAHQMKASSKFLPLSLFSLKIPMTAAPASAEGEKVSLKDQGNEFFKSGKYLKAAIKQDTSNPTLYR
ncbi:hypothetical protein QN277_018921 [Acacia crassicarpa]|uniref:Uncharacterized protein n=1 Tax=Acacia crassicarpa TaxID=499986 RepID=A0AAE1JVK8_9FABA|nr:hypothetical protein QN277_018921 [Acacia crassicarpa]